MTHALFLTGLLALAFGALAGAGLALIVRGLRECNVMSKLNAAERKRLKSSDFALPSERRYPIENESHARNALAMVARYGTDAEKERVKAAVHARYPGIC